MQALLAGELVGPVRGADGHGQRIAAALGDEFGRLRRIGQADAAGHVLLDAAELPEFGLDDDPLGMARSTTRRVISMFFASGSCEASIITEL